MDAVERTHSCVPTWAETFLNSPRLQPLEADLQVFDEVNRYVVQHGSFAR
jgi:hypothetical protein